MKASGLRIGNLVDVINRHPRINMPFGIVRRIGEIQFFKVRLYQFDKPFAVQPEPEPTEISDLSPIPLTEEWIKDYWMNGGAVISLLTWEGSDFIHWTKEDGVFLDGESFDNEGTVYLSHIKYVHQLQNLYFALTGEELTIKP
jgi:hypothetical protein